MLGIKAHLGRTNLPDDDVSPGGHPVVLLAHGYWQDRYDGDPAAVGQTVRLGGRGYEIIGVAASDYAGSARGITPAFYAPMMMVEELLGETVLNQRFNHSLFPKARLRPGVTLPPAEAALAAVAADLTATRPSGWDRTNAFALLPSSDVLVFPAIDRFVRGVAGLLVVVVGLVLLLACTNLASFGPVGVGNQVDGPTSRRHAAAGALVGVPALGVRRAADAVHLVRLLTSSALKLVLAGAAIGLATSLVVTRLLGGLLFGGDTLDPVTFVAVPVVLGLTAVVAAYLPARRAARLNPVAALRE